MTRFGLPVMGICLVFGLAAGCGSDKSTEPEPTPDPYPAGSTPEGAVKRFVAVYNAMNSTEFARLLTEDFTFEFSGATNPDLVTQFASGWFKDDEVTAATNLFHGGMASSGVLYSGAGLINLVFQEKATRPDTTQGRDSTFYRVLLTPITLRIDLPPNPGEAEGTTFIIGGSAPPMVHRFFFVRGDEAQLEADQPADSLHWYLWRWLDESSSQLAPDLRWRSQGELDPNQPEPTTWGTVKAIYR